MAKKLIKCNTLFLFAIDVNIVFFEFFFGQLYIAFRTLVNELFFVDLGGHNVGNNFSKSKGRLMS